MAGGLSGADETMRGGLLMAVPDGQEQNLDAIRTAEETIRIGLTWVPDKHAVAPTDALATLLAALAQLQAERDAAREALQNVVEFLETVTEWTGSSGEELAEELDAINAALAPAPEAETT